MIVWILQAQTVNQKYYIEILTEVKASMSEFVEEVMDVA